ncbi:MAG: EAL domain-containing protein [Colwellia sp.]|nr:EAL domain-containing protein [Colwellia sp.]
MLKQLVCNYSISTRLKIFLLLPWLIILGLGISYTDEYLADIQQARQASLSITISSEIDHLTYELQKERGLTAGVIYKVNDLDLLQLKKQRLQTDERIQSYLDFIERIELSGLELNTIANSHVISNVLKEIEVIIQELPQQRRKVGINNGGSYFTYYTDFIEQLLRLISQVQLNNTEQNRANVDFLSLLNLQEKSGQERGALNAMLNSRPLDAGKLQQVISYGNEQVKLISDLFSVSRTHHQQIFAINLNSDVNQQVLKIRETLKERLTRVDKLSKLERELGFFGLIHDFKNYVIRGEKQYFTSFLKHQSVSDELIANFQKDNYLSTNESKAIQVIKATLNQYSEQIWLAKSLREKGYNAEQIDEKVRINNKPIAAAIKTMIRSELRINSKYWWELSSKRISQLREVSDHILADIRVLAKQEEAKAIEKLTLYLTSFLFIFISSLYFSFLAVKHIIEKIKYIKSAMATMQVEHKFNQPLLVRGNDEITDMVLAFNQMVAERNKYEGDQKVSAAVFKYASEAIMISNGNNEIESVNPAFCHISGYSLEEVLGKSPNVLTSGKHDSSFYQDMWQALDNDSCWQGEIWNKRKNGEIYPEFLSISVVRDKDNKPIQYISLFSDITKHKKFEEDIWLQANFDSLTGLPNRNLFVDRLHNELKLINRNESELALLFIDLDRFKYVNDTWGHNSGDQLLKLAAIRLSNCVREKDTVSRFGGDEFVVLLLGLTNRLAIERVVKNILSSLSLPFYLHNNNEAVVSASIGVTLAPCDGNSVEVLLKNADTAMYQAKSAGRNTYQFFLPSMNESLNQRMYIEQALRQAIKNKEFVLHYQPVVLIGNGGIVGAEALIRWQHPNKGLVYPDSFIGIAEETGLIEPIGQWVIEQACSDLKQWHEQGVAMQVAVNVSSRQCKQSCQTPIREILSNALKANKIGPSYIKVEITESLLMDNSQEMITTLQGIRSLGVAIHLDDFGTGYSSLSYLKNFPIDILKIDRSFIEGAIDDKTDASLVEAVVRIGHSLSLKLVGEGIETKQHYDYLRSLGCDYGQGYLMSKPIPFDEFIYFCQQNDEPAKWLELEELV